MRTRIKVCGITSVEDADAAVRAGVDAIGLVFAAESPRRITTTTARRIVATLPPFVQPVALFVNARAENIVRTCLRCNICTVQLHGEERPEIATKLSGLNLIKAVRVAGGELYEDRQGWFAWARSHPRLRLSFLLDAYWPAARGGTGRRFDWQLARPQLLRDKLGYEGAVILAGGLNSRNVARAIRIVRPWAVDVSTGVESRPGVKDADRLRRFVRAVQNADAKMR